MARAVVALLGLVVVGILAVHGFDAGLATAGDDRAITGEQFTPNAGTVQELENSNRAGVYYDEQVTVINDSSDRMVAGVDYEWYEHNGTIKPLAGGGLDGATNAEIDYTFHVPSDNQRGIADALGVTPFILEMAIPLGGVILVLLFLKGLA